MCFFDQYKYACGHFKWGRFKQHCSKEYRVGETCGCKIVMSRFPLDSNCRACDKSNSQLRRREAERQRITQWQKERDSIGVDNFISSPMTSMISVDSGDGTMSQVPQHPGNAFAMRPYFQEGILLSSTKTAQIRSDRYLAASREVPHDLGVPCKSPYLHNVNDVAQSIATTDTCHREVAGSSVVQGDLNSDSHPPTTQPFAAPGASLKDVPKLQEKAKSGLTDAFIIDGQRGEGGTQSRYRDGPDEEIVICGSGNIQGANEEKSRSRDEGEQVDGVIIANQPGEGRTLEVEITYDNVDTQAKKRARFGGMRNEMIDDEGSKREEEVPGFSDTWQEYHCQEEDSFLSPGSDDIAFEDTQTSIKPTRFERNTSTKGFLAPSNLEYPDVADIDRFLKEGGTLGSLHVSSPSDSAVNLCQTDPSDETGKDSQSSHNPIDCLERVKHTLLVTLMSDFYEMLNSKSTSFECTDGTGKGKQTKKAPVQIQSSIGKQQQYQGQKDGKKRWMDRGPPNGDDEDDNDSDNEPPTSRQGRKIPRYSNPLACPFHKFNRAKYSINNDTGGLYRACAGPGFQKISEVKQHLRRKHQSIQCHRCWTVMGSSDELTTHASAAEACQVQIPQPEGVDAVKMNQIGSWGVSWEKIFEIIFPGCPIPNFEPDLPQEERSTNTTSALSPGSQELLEFEAYNRTALPLLVEANLRTVIDSQLKPIEEDLKAALTDIVRRCQTMVADNFQVMKNKSSDATIASASPDLRRDSSNPFDVHSNIGKSSRPSNFSHPPTAFYQEPQLLDPEAANFMPINAAQNVYNAENVDSGYGSLTRNCLCICHDLMESTVAALSMTASQAAPSPDSLQLKLSINVPEPVPESEKEPVQVLLVFVGNHPALLGNWYSINATLDGKEFIIPEPENSMPIWSVSQYYYGNCTLYTIEGLKFNMINYGEKIPVTIHVNPATPFARGSCTYPAFGPESSGAQPGL
ncbi:uncharacterized protein KY384_001632 [Bacidia gigantensis]|uniref:uncharacterized protein n=1 Tax=Bacidia gigantensis TaxID=2732470 RepID=UPI001D04D59A|nr:uncharacterized protein KY384_001632 [Bacidia gigantensis]KAG8533891.1 hypothetical protein KY384_001632 [Bacidia gigantensis]